MGLGPLRPYLGARLHRLKADRGFPCWRRLRAWSRDWAGWPVHAPRLVWQDRITASAFGGGPNSACTPRPGSTCAGMGVVLVEFPLVPHRVPSPPVDAFLWPCIFGWQGKDKTPGTLPGPGRPTEEGPCPPLGSGARREPSTPPAGQRRPWDSRQRRRVGGDERGNRQRRDGGAGRERGEGEREGRERGERGGTTRDKREQTNEITTTNGDGRTDRQTDKDGREGDERKEGEGGEGEWTGGG